MEIKERFEVFHRSDKEVYELYKRYALFRCELGNKVVSKLLFEIIREEHGKTLDNDFTPYYSRRFCRDFPEYKHLFKFRKLKK
tara:strand:+ start:1507 stop:1755 length:249 start_codon:yes stop_codon:yes gene_type:complete